MIIFMLNVGCALYKGIWGFPQNKQSEIKFDNFNIKNDRTIRVAHRLL